MENKYEKMLEGVYPDQGDALQIPVIIDRALAVRKEAIKRHMTPIQVDTAEDEFMMDVTKFFIKTQKDFEKLVGKFVSGLEKQYGDKK